VICLFPITTDSSRETSTNWGDFLAEDLWDELNGRVALDSIKDIKIPQYISGNLKHSLRPYQIQAFQNHIFCEDNRETLEISRGNFVYNMATGSGKTLIMAGLILYYYSRGYRDFLFFVNRRVIIDKTKDNFLHKWKDKYIFGENIVINGSEVSITEISNFSESHPDHINIHFTSMSKIQVDMREESEGSFTKTDFSERPVVFIGDEYHHYHRAKWGGTMEDLVDQNSRNIYLGFTATLNQEAQETIDKDKGRIVMKYDLAAFRRDKFSKEPCMHLTQADKRGRIVQSLIANLYRSLVASDNKINLKPVILYKSKNVEPSKESYREFQGLIDQLSGTDISPIRENCDDGDGENLLSRAFEFFTSKALSDSDIAERISANFKNSAGGYNILTVDIESEYNDPRNHELLNTLESGSNPIRAIFTVDKLNEGWDVQNLFDIVRLYEGQNSGGKGVVGKTTNAEAQLIGRGARYWPFEYKDKDKFKRKFDGINHDLRILEELHFHAKEESRYISEIRRGLTEIGFGDDGRKVKIDLKMKERFVASDFYDTGKIAINQKIECSDGNVIPFDELSVQKYSVPCHLSSSSGTTVKIFEEEEMGVAEEQNAPVEKVVRLSQFPTHVLRFALSYDDFFHFDKLVDLYPDLTSISDFITDYLGGLEISFNGSEGRIENISNTDYLLASQNILGKIKEEIKANMSEYESSDWISKDVKEVFEKTVTITLEKDTTRHDGQSWVKGKRWYAHNQNHGTDQEIAFIETFNRQFDWRYLHKFEEVHILRNEQELSIYDESGRGFRPDFILFCKERGTNLVRQVFIEPKGEHLKQQDEWKEDFLKRIQTESNRLTTDFGEILICAASFYNYSEDKQFREELTDILELPSKEDVRPSNLRNLLEDIDRLPAGDPLEKYELIELLDGYVDEKGGNEPDWDWSETLENEAEEIATMNVVEFIGPVWSELTVDQLKKYLRAVRLPVSGKKADLVTRITEAEPTTEPNWEGMNGLEIKRYLKVFPNLYGEFLDFVNDTTD